MNRKTLAWLAERMEEKKTPNEWSRAFNVIIPTAHRWTDWDKPISIGGFVLRVNGVARKHPTTLVPVPKGDNPTRYQRYDAVDRLIFNAANVVYSHDNGKIEGIEDLRHSVKTIRCIMPDDLETPVTRVEEMI